MRARIAMYVVLACLISALQFGLYDCSGVPALSFGAGALTILAVLLVSDRVYAVARSSRPSGSRLATAIAVGVIGAGLALALGVFTRITHLCG
jgi:hypothetical protein